MRILLDTNILIHRESATVVRDDIGILFHWLDRLGHEKWIHPVSVWEIGQHGDARVRRSFATKLTSYRKLLASAPLAPAVDDLSRQVDSDDRSRRDSRILNEVYADRVDLLITEDRSIGRKALALGIADRVFTIEGFLEKATAENPSLIEYEVPSVQQIPLANLDVTDRFFDSLRSDYGAFDRWFVRKSQDLAYVCFQQSALVAFLYLKVENEGEPYPEIVPPFARRRRLKIGTLKVAMNGFKLGERFLKVVFDNALRQRVDEIYVTVFDRDDAQARLIRLLETFGFVHHGQKHDGPLPEQVYVRDMAPVTCSEQPKLTFPFVSRKARHFLVPIYPKYHTDLFPDSILNTESPGEFVEHEPHRNAIRKVYVSRARFRDLQAGDVLVFYRTGGLYKSVVTTIGIVEEVHQSLATEGEFLSKCRRRSVFSDDDLRKHWRYRPAHRPCIVEFLHAYSLPKRPNMKTLIDAGVIADINSAPRGFERITSDQFDSIIRLSRSDTRIIIG